MNFVNLPIFILFFAVAYLVGIYGLITIAQMLKQENNFLSRNRDKPNNQVKIP